ncbi:hypothetical protein [Paenibacillus sp. FSL K6-2524]|uniref:hypothetical protein n=1 Tax=Paenibacillus sp. FSL K6-2524 TaxID=2954516 RepID=UPI0030F74E1C
MGQAVFTDGSINLSEEKNKFPNIFTELNDHYLMMKDLQKAYKVFGLDENRIMTQAVSKTPISAYLKFYIRAA